MSRRFIASAVVLSVILAVGWTLFSSANGPTFSQAARALPRPPNIVMLGHELQREGFHVSEHPAFGGVCTNHCHVTGSAHYSGRAIDINHDQGNEGRALDALAPRLRRAGWMVLWRVTGHFDHAHAQYR